MTGFRSVQKMDVLRLTVTDGTSGLRKYMKEAKGSPFCQGDPGDLGSRVSRSE